MLDLYAQDSFFTLSVAGRTGLVLLSATMAGLTLWLAWRLSRGRHLFLRGLIGFGLFAAFEWLSPQVYYTYYLTLFNTLKSQWVIGSPPGLATLFGLLTFTDNANLSFHSRGLLGWALILLPLVNAYRVRKLLGRL
ncbi:MAG: hypothetical protein AAGI12_15025 [Pseudomonadota bacterium]